MNYYQFAICSSLLLGAAAFGCTDSKSKQPEASIHLMWEDIKQPIDGFGIAQAGWADQLYAHKKRDQVMGEMFGKEGLRLNILRGEVFPHYWESKADTDFDLNDKLDVALTDTFFEKRTDDLLRRGQLWLTKQAKEKYHVEKLFFSTWSAPAYMKSNGKVSQGELKPEYYQAFADYLAGFYKAYASVGLTPYAISPSNEPSYAAPWNSSLWTAEKMGDFIFNYLGPTFEREQIDTKIIFGENPLWSTVSTQVAMASSLNFVNSILDKYPTIAKYNLIASGHGYALPETLPLDKDSLRTPIVPFTQAIEKDIPVWVTEISKIDALDPSMSDGLQWANTFHAYLVDASVNAFVWWAGAMPTGNNESLIVLNKDRDNYSLTKRYETFGNFTRYIKPKSQRIETMLSSKTDSLLVSAYKLNKEYTVVAINNSQTALVTSLQIDNKQLSGKLKGYHTDEKNCWTPCEYTMNREKQYIVEIPAKSVITFTGSL
jgi:O-glycosyl hydrolase